MSQPCLKLNPVLDEVAVLLKRDLKVWKLNVDDHPKLSMWYEIWRIPTLLCFIQQKVAFRIVGKASKRMILSRLKPVLTGINAMDDRRTLKQSARLSQKRTIQELIMKTTTRYKEAWAEN